MGKKAMIISIIVCALALIAAIIAYFKISSDTEALFTGYGSDKTQTAAPQAGLSGLIMPHNPESSTASTVSPETDNRSSPTDILGDFDFADFEYSAPDDGWLGDLDGINNDYADNPPDIPAVSYPEYYEHPKYSDYHDLFPDMYPDTVQNAPSASDTYSEPSESAYPNEYEEPVSLLYDYKNKWAYNKLNSKLKKIYELIYNSAEQNTNEISLTQYDLTEDELSKAYWSFDYDNPQFLNLGSGYGYTVQGSRIVSMGIQYGRSAAPQEKFLSAAENILDSARQYSDDYSRIKYIHDTIVNRTEYLVSNNAYASEADGPIIYGSALCEGYSKAFMYFCQALDIPCVCVGGFARGEGHMWNKVQLDGKWYNVDCTWDDPVTDTGESVIRWDYFLKSDSTFNADHVTDNYFPLPSSPSDY